MMSEETSGEVWLHDVSKDLQQMLDNARAENGQIDFVLLAFVGDRIAYLSNRDNDAVVLDLRWTADLLELENREISHRAQCQPAS